MEDPSTAQDLLAARLSDVAAGLARARLALDEEAAVRAQEIKITTAKLRAAKRAVKLALAAIAVAVAAAIIGLVVTLGQNVQDRAQASQLERVVEDLERVVAQQALDRCETGNTSRQAIRDGFDAYTAALVAVPPTAPRTPEQQAAYEARIAAFQADIAARLTPLAPRDCSPQALGVPTTGD